MTQQADLWAASVRRTTYILVVITAAGAATCIVLRGTRYALGFCIGAAISLLSFRRWKAMVEVIGPASRGGLRTLWLVLRPILIAAVLYAILRFSGLNLMAALLGLFVSAAAVAIEAVYQVYAGS